MGKRLKLLAIMFAAMVLLTVGFMNTGAKVYDSEEKLVENYDTYSLVNSREFVKDNILSGSAGKMEGMGTIWKYNAEESTDVEITYRIKIFSGKAKLVLISPDDTLTTLAECTEDSDAKQKMTKTFHAEKGKNRIKLVGAKGTKLEYEISIDEGRIRSFS